MNSIPDPSYLKSFIKNYENYPKKGISFKDISPLVNNPELFEQCVFSLLVQIFPDALKKGIPSNSSFTWAGIESRGFIFASALSFLTHRGLTLIRKGGKLPDRKQVVGTSYKLEYGQDKLEMYKGKGDIIIVDDVLATGGTLKAANSLAKKAGYSKMYSVCLVDIGLLKKHKYKCVISY